MAKTIFITSFHVLISRNILATPLLELLGQGGVEVVLLVPDGKREFFVRQFAGPGVRVEGVPTGLVRRDALLRYFALAGLATRTLAIKRKTEMGGSGEWAATLAGNRGVTRCLVRRASSLLTPRRRFSTLFEQYRPALVFATDVQNENDVRLLHEAHDRGTKTVGMVRSWDNLTAKGLIRFIPELLIVNNDIIKAEAVRLHAVPAALIRVVGIPHYDRYPAPAHPREEFSRRLGLDPAKPFLVYAPTGDRYLAKNRVDREVIRIIAAALPPDFELLVRMPPTDSANLEAVIPPHVIVHRPGTHLSSQPGVFKLSELTRDDDDLLRDTLAYGDLVVAGPSTIVVDAAVFDTPIILVGFDGDAAPPYYESIRRYWDYDHLGPILSSGGARLARSAEELRTWLGRYLGHPSYDRTGRERIRLEQCARLDGRSSQRLAEVLLETLRN